LDGAERAEKVIENHFDGGKKDFDPTRLRIQGKTKNCRYHSEGKSKALFVLAVENQENGDWAH